MSCNLAFNEMQWEGSGVLNRGVAWSNYCSNRIIMYGRSPKDSDLPSTPSFHKQVWRTAHRKVGSMSSPLESGTVFWFAFPSGIRQMRQSGNSISIIRALEASTSSFIEAGYQGKSLATVRPSHCAKAWPRLVERPSGEERRNVANSQNCARILYYYPMSWVISVIELWSHTSWDHRQWSGDKS